MKVETHNHNRHLSVAGAATGSGGGVVMKAPPGVARETKKPEKQLGCSVSNLRIPGFEQPWEGGFLASRNVLSPRWIS